jgi:tRNA-splicing ligase RtcB (3'-phosphate/5'-hydroxy nucleic acid ligase)
MNKIKFKAMNHLNIKGEDLLAIGFPQTKAIGLAIKAIEKNYRGTERQTVIDTLSKVIASPEQYLEDDIFAETAQALIEKIKVEEEAATIIPLKEIPSTYEVYGASHIEAGAIHQMEVAVKLPVTVAGALMPDAHQGYGLPIGGVLATKNAVIPYGVGVDIGCRMALSVYDGWHGKDKAQHAILDSSAFDAIPFVKNLHMKAAEQLGTSGGGNHFVEFGIIEFEVDDAILNIKKGKYLALLTHSGSRGFGATIAGHYTKLAKELCRLPQEAQNLAYLDMNSAEGQEYWLAMNLAGDYASACHEVIHERIAKAIGAEVLTKVENHHNFAWKELWHGEEVIVHRKGATPAGKGVMGIIPGSMTAPGFLVRGKGHEAAINSASHGAGRQMSRTQAIKNISQADMRQMLKDHGVTLIGAGLDEAPMAYKNIETVMAAQTELVDTIAKFSPKLVRMADDGSKED